MTQTFSNHDFNIVKNGSSNRYSINDHPNRESHVLDSVKTKGNEFPDDDFFIKVTNKVKGRNKTFKIEIF